MNLSDINRFLVEMFQGDPHVLAAFIMGILVTVLVIIIVYWWIYRGRIAPDVAALEHKLDQEKGISAALSGMVKEKEARIHDLGQECEKIKEQLADTDTQLAEATAKLSHTKKAGRSLKRKAIRVRDRYKQQIDVMLRQLVELEHLQGKFWQQPAKGKVPTFRPLVDRQTPIIAAFNLKGGVGKTSLTAHLGASLWAAGKKVLFIDLDYQGSLSRLLLSVEQIKDANHGNKYVDRLFTTEGDLGQETWNLLMPIVATNSYLLAAREKLGEVEEMTKARWLMDAMKQEPRYSLRAALHNDLLQHKFDYILVDCPPRLSTACVNALTASDFVLVPTLFDKTSRDAVGRLCETLRHFVKTGLCPNLQILGIVGNQSSRRPSLTIKESSAWNQVKRDAKDNWGEPVYLFKRHVPKAKAFADASETGRLADRSPQLSSLFSDLSKELIKEVEKRIASHAESAGPAAVR